MFLTRRILSVEFLLSVDTDTVIKLLTEYPYCRESCTDPCQVHCWVGSQFASKTGHPPILLMTFLTGAAPSCSIKSVFMQDAYSRFTFWKGKISFAWIGSWTRTRNWSFSSFSITLNEVTWVLSSGITVFCKNVPQANSKKSTHLKWRRMDLKKLNDLLNYPMGLTTKTVSVGNPSRVIPIKRTDLLIGSFVLKQLKPRQYTPG